MTAELTQLKVRVTPELRRRLKVFAAQVDRPMNDLVVEAIEAYLKRKGRKP
jgi:predicted DNA-binding protein